MLASSLIPGRSRPCEPEPMRFGCIDDDAWENTLLDAVPCEAKSGAGMVEGWSVNKSKRRVDMPETPKV